MKTDRKIIKEAFAFFYMEESVKKIYDESSFYDVFGEISIDDKCTLVRILNKYDNINDIISTKEIPGPFDQKKPYKEIYYNSEKIIFMDEKRMESLLEFIIKNPEAKERIIRGIENKIKPAYDETTICSDVKSGK